MNELIQILEAAQLKHGTNTPLTIGHMLNICKMAKRAKTKQEENEAIREANVHWEIVEDISFCGQN